MKLFELYADLEGIQDQMQQRDNEDANWSPIDKRMVDSERKPNTPRRSSNISKARKIANRIRMHKRQSNPVGNETHHQSNLGGHVSTWLHR